jgi:hypothetical protein
LIQKEQDHWFKVLTLSRPKAVLSHRATTNRDTG